MIHLTSIFSRIFVITAHWISSGVGSGYANVAPGTFGSAAALIFWWLLWSCGILSGFESGVLLCIITTLVGVLAIRRCLRAEGAGSDPQLSDPQWIVIDEWAGMFLALIGTSPAAPLEVLSLFVAFRLFDALKPGPVGWAEDLPGAFGIMADDIVAGALAWGVVQGGVYLIGLYI